MAKEVKKQSKFVAEYLKQINKTPEEAAIEKVTRFVEDSIIECESAIAQLETANIPQKKLEIKRAENDLVKATKAYEESKYKVQNTFELYLEARNKAEEALEFSTVAVSTLKEDLKYLQEQVKKYKEVLKDLKETI